MEPIFAIPAILVFTVVGVAIFVRIITSPIRGAKHIYNATNPNANPSDKKESREILKETSNQVSNYLAFMFSCFALIALIGLVAILQLPYLVNLILGLLAAALLVYLYFYFQNR
jgi:predicted PurR-regulated permease PerM